MGILHYTLDKAKNICYLYYVNRSTAIVSTTVVDTIAVGKERRGDVNYD